MSVDSSQVSAVPGGSLSEASLLPIYVVSLAQDVERRDRMRQRFGVDMWQTFEVVRAVEARSLPREIPKPCKHNRRKPLGDAEKACALSHMDVWRRFLSTGAPACIILEDDALGDTTSVEKSVRLMHEMADGEFVLLGGQDGLRNRSYVFGAPQIRAGVKIWRLYRPGRRFLARTSSYGLTRAAASRLLKKQQKCLDRADHWRRLLRDSDFVYITSLFAHPVDLTESHIELERIASGSKRSIWRSVWTDGIIYTFHTSILKRCWPLIARVFRLERVFTGGAH